METVYRYPAHVHTPELYRCDFCFHGLSAPLICCRSFVYLGHGVHVYIWVAGRPIYPIRYIWGRDDIIAPRKVDRAKLLEMDVFYYSLFDSHITI